VGRKQTASSSLSSNDTLSQDGSSQGAERHPVISIWKLSTSHAGREHPTQQMSAEDDSGSCGASTNFRKAKMQLFTGASPGTAVAGR